MLNTSTDTSTDTSTLPQQRKLLRAAIKILETRGWCQGALEDSKGRCCALGAIDAAQLETGSSWQVNADVQRALEKATRQDSIPEWNDRPRRRIGQVIKTFKRVLGLLKQS